MNRFFYLSPLILQTAIWPIVRPLFRFFLHLEILGLENLKKVVNTYGREQMPPNGVIFAVNHSSELDPILVPASLPFLSLLMPFFYTSREQTFYKTSGWRQFFYGGFLFKLWGSHPVRTGKQNYEESLATHIEILNRGRSVCIFPEGRKTKDGDIGREAHGGVAYLAYRARAPVMPVRIKGVFKMTLREFLLRKRNAEVIFGAPLSPTELFYTNDTQPQDICVGGLLQNMPPSLAEIKTAAHRVLGAIQQL
jgi:1-acyl-sn-glycerol-3-phosphate acyltransferase